MRTSSDRSICRDRAWARRALAGVALGVLQGGAPACASATRAAGERTAGSAAPSGAAAEWRARGDADMDAGAFADAISAYRSSYELSRNEAILYDLGTAHERLGDYPQALAYLEQFAHVASPELRARVPMLPQILEGIRARLAHILVRCNVPGAHVIVRGTWRGTTPAVSELWVMPGPARVEVVAEGHFPLVEDLSLAAGSSTQIDASLPVDPSAREERASGGTITTKWWFWTGLSVIVVGGVGLGFALTREKSAPSSDIAPGKVAAPLASW
jgi:hypothetical protein